MRAMDMQEETFAERRRRIDLQLTRDFNRAMMPMLMAMTVATGALLGLCIVTVTMPLLPKPFISMFLLATLVVGLTPMLYTIIKYR